MLLYLKSLGFFSALGTLTVTPLTLFSKQLPEYRKVKIFKVSETQDGLLNWFSGEVGAICNKNQKCKPMKDWIYTENSLLYECEREKLYTLYFKKESMDSISKITDNIIEWIHKKGRINNFRIAFIIVDQE